MKLLVFILISIGLCSAQEQQICHGEYVKEVLQQCLEITGTDIDAIFRIRHSLKSKTENEKCFRACALQVCKFMDNFGNVYPDTIKPYLKYLTSDADKQKRSYELAIKCHEDLKAKTDICDIAEEYTECFLQCPDCGFDLVNF